MFAALMVFSALALLAVVLVGGWWIMSELRAIERHTDFRLGTLHEQLREQMPTALKIEVDDLRGALDVLRASNRKEFGSVWSRLGGRRSAPAILDGGTGLPLEGDDEIAAMVALQRANPVQVPE